MVMCELNCRPEFPALRQPDEMRGFTARENLSARLDLFSVISKNGKPTVPFAELIILLGVLALVFG